MAEARGIVLRRHGADLLGLCPFHDDHEPSLVISAAKNLWHGMGACGAGGSVIDWVMRTEGLSFRHAVELLRCDQVPLGSGRERSGAVPKRASTRHPLSEVGESAPTTGDSEGPNPSFEGPFSPHGGLIEGSSRVAANGSSPAASRPVGARVAQKPHQPNASGSHVGMRR